MSHTRRALLGFFAGLPLAWKAMATERLVPDERSAAGMEFRVTGIDADGNRVTEQVCLRPMKEVHSVTIYRHPGLQEP